MALPAVIWVLACKKSSPASLPLRNHAPAHHIDDLLGLAQHGAGDKLIVLAPPFINAMFFLKKMLNFYWITFKQSYIVHIFIDQK